MAGKKTISVYWTHKSVQNAFAIQVYIEENFTAKEINSFYSLLSAFEDAVSVFPELYPLSKEYNIRRAVLSKELSVFYRILKNRVEVLAVLDNRCNISDWL